MEFCMNYFVTGAAGFIGSYVSCALLEKGHRVIAVDSLNDYYSPELKQFRLKNLLDKKGFTFFAGRIEDSALLEHIFSANAIDRVIHLAAQAGVCYSIENPAAYGSANLTGFLNILEACRKYKPDHLVFASSSSVYGLNKKTPYAETDAVDHPISLYAATKKANEVMAHSYSHLYGIPATGLRFFTVYGPLGRPDMAYFKFAEKILKGKTIDVYNQGDMLRDFTYIDDIVRGVIDISNFPPSVQSTQSAKTETPDISFSAPFEIYNIGNSCPERLTDFISILEDCLGKKAEKRFLPMQPGDVYITAADTAKLYRKIGWKPSTPLTEGLQKFASWFLKFYNID